MACQLSLKLSKSKHRDAIYTVQRSGKRCTLYTSSAGPNHPHTCMQGYSAVITPDPNVWDIAVIKLSAPIGLSTGWLGILEPCGESAPARYVANTVGYPSDMPTGSCKFTQCAVTQTPCTDSYLYHKCDTASGQSGSPLWMLALTTARKMGPYIRAVHNIEW